MLLAGMLGAGVMGAAVLPAPAMAAGLKTWPGRSWQAADPSPRQVVMAWGENYAGQLGNGSDVNGKLPAPVSLPAGVTISGLASGYDFSLALTSTGQVWAWGANWAGQLGNGTTTDSPVPVEVRLPAGTEVTEIAAGEYHALARTSDGQVLSWGDNRYGQLGNGTTTSSDVPVAVSLPAGVAAASIAAGGYHSLALTAAGQVLAWGDNSYAQLGTEPYAYPDFASFSSEPLLVSLPGGVTAAAIAGGQYHSLALTTAGRVLAWGYGNYGQLGNGSNDYRSAEPVQAQLPGGALAVAIAAGGSHSLAITSAGKVLAWGDNGWGQLGDGSTSNQNLPVEAHLPAGAVVTALAAGQSHTLALTKSGQVLAWGYGRVGQLGNGTTSLYRDQPARSQLPARAVATAIASGVFQSLALVRMPGSTSTMLTVSPPEQREGRPVTLTARVACQAGTPSGMVTFRTDGTVLGSAALRDGVARLTVSTLKTGRHVITARYEGDQTCGPSESGPVNVTIAAHRQPLPRRVPVTG